MGNVLNKEMESMIVNLTNNIEIKRLLLGCNKTDMARVLKIHVNTYQNKVLNPLTFTLSELIELQKFFKSNSINELMGIDENGKVIRREI